MTHVAVASGSSTHHIHIISRKTELWLEIHEINDNDEAFNRIVGVRSKLQKPMEKYLAILREKWIPLTIERRLVQAIQVRQFHWAPSVGMETHVLVLFLDLNGRHFLYSIDSLIVIEFKLKIHCFPLVQLMASRCRHKIPAKQTQSEIAISIRIQGLQHGMRSRFQGGREHHAIAFGDEFDRNNPHDSIAATDFHPFLRIDERRGAR